MQNILLAHSRSNFVAKLSFQFCCNSPIIAKKNPTIKPIFYFNYLWQNGEKVRKKSAIKITHFNSSAKLHATCCGENINFACNKFLTVSVACLNLHNSWQLILNHNQREKFFFFFSKYTIAFSFNSFDFIFCIQCLINEEGKTLYSYYNLYRHSSVSMCILHGVALRLAICASQTQSSHFYYSVSETTVC